MNRNRIDMSQRKLLFKDRPLIYKYPRTFVTVATTASLLAFFSKPIYDLFTADASQIDVEELKRSHKSRFGKV